ncbi:MAG: ATP-dependent helicase RecG [Thermoleophilaceae bacterium]|nr:ATP-dependent helicase RecG [Thermoleophilaceae bacterium]MEA2470255.1 ATP-dependent helicase RecG [Thermoleophilaceae bacterium]
MRAFASTEELDPAPASRPRPSALEAGLEVKPARAAKAAEALGLHTVGDLIEHFPFRHEERREARPIASLGPDEDVTVIGEVRRISSRRGRGRLTIQTATVFDESGPVKVVWFNQPWLVDRLPPGTRLVLHGRFRGHGRGLTVSEHELSTGAAHTTGVVPVYPATENLKSLKIRELVWSRRAAIKQVVEPLPTWLRLAEKLPDRPAAVDAIHFPENEDEEPTARRRLAFEELFLLELALAARKRARQSELAAPAVDGSGELVDPWLASLPFALTGDQRAAVATIAEDMAAERPMQRLLMGEVGSGKTVVALHAMLRTVEADRQAVLMAPTETLAEQHMATLDRLLGGHVPIALLTGSTPAGRRRELLGRLATGELALLVGTHALIEPAVEFRDLALVVVDEQHRFGVRQRAALEAKSREGTAPHALHMTATPIPRTLRWTRFGELDVTTLHELPAGRRPIETHVGNTAAWRARAYDRAREEIAAGRQVFVVCPLVEESEALQAAAATKEAERLGRTEFRDHRVALIHGQMGSKDKQEAMRAFVAREADVLVATSVIEVGIDVPNASVMIVEAAERYGISQLHQLRGRIGRGPHASVCILFGDPGLPRLRALAEHRDGFRLSEIDLEIRGHGDLFGTRQHGEALMRVARLPEDEELLVLARRRADELLDRDPALEAPEHALLRDAAAVADPVAA